jgi:hypothetical protein
MPRVCTVCSHADRLGIENDLFRNNVSFREVSKRHGVTVSALFRHKQHLGEEKVRKAGAALQPLPVRKQRYIEGVVAGKSRKQAALDAGYSEAMAEHPGKLETADVRQAFTALVRQTIPPERIVGVLEAGLAATKVQSEREIADFGERRQYAELAAEYGQYVAPAKTDAQAASGVVIVLPQATSEPRQPGEPKPVIEAMLVVEDKPEEQS